MGGVCINVVECSARLLEARGTHQMLEVAMGRSLYEDCPVWQLGESSVRRVEAGTERERETALAGRGRAPSPLFGRPPFVNKHVTIHPSHHIRPPQALLLVPVPPTTTTTKLKLSLCGAALIMTVYGQVPSTQGVLLLAATATTIVAALCCFVIVIVVVVGSFPPQKGQRRCSTQHARPASFCGRHD